MKKKIVSIALVVALLAIAVAGTLAYFTDDTDKMANTFTMGKVEITLTESSPAKDGYVQGVVGTNAIDYPAVLPGQQLSKCPVITVDEKSQSCYVYAELIVKGYAELYKALTAADVDPTKLDELLLNPALGTLVTDAAWMDDDDNFHIVYTNGIMVGGAAWTLFDGIKVPEDFTQEIVEGLGTVELDIMGYAIQAAEIADADAGWKELGIQQ